MANESLPELVARLGASATALAVLAAELRAKVSHKPLHPALAPFADAVLREVGAKEALNTASIDELAPLLADLRHFWQLDAEYFARPDAAPGWTSVDVDVLASAGEVTQGFPDVLARMIAPR